jgi:hypothetical protein
LECGHLSPLSPLECGHLLPLSPFGVRRLIAAFFSLSETWRGKKKESGDK